MKIKQEVLSGLLVLLCTCGLSAVAGDLDWPQVQTENRPGCYWWWMGSAVDRENITWNLETMRKAGMGGGTIVPIYGVRGYEDRYIQHLSPQFVEMVSYAAKEADRLGMWVDMTTGTGWPFGGPMITDAYQDVSPVYKNGSFSTRFSGTKVKRAAPGGAGRAVSPYSTEALAFYLSHFDAAFDKEGVQMPRAMYHDSFEIRADWCKDMPEQFKRRRGYDIMAHLPELFGKGDPDTVERVKSDVRETFSDLHIEYIQAWVKWSASKGCITRDQAHGGPGNLLDTYAAADIPETEIFGATRFNIPGVRLEEDNYRNRDQPQPLINRMASSAAHVTGKPLVASETCTWIRNHFRTSLAQAKPEVDQLFLNGINHVFFHGTCYSPKGAPWPGWLFYASFEYNPRNAIWRDAPLLNAYITRCQSILQSGEHDNDVALYWPVYDLWHDAKGMKQKFGVHIPGWLVDAPCGKLAQQLVDGGFTFDYISDRQLLNDLGKPYKAVLVPTTKHMPLGTLKKLLQSTAQGQPIYFVDSLPKDVPGFHRLEERRAELGRLIQGQETRVVKSADLGEALAKASVVREPMVDRGLDFIRRRHDRGYHYFVANMGATAVNGWVPLGVPFSTAAILDPRSAATGVAPQRGKEVYLQLKPGETRILRTFDQQTIDGDRWPILTKSSDPLVVNGIWKITFIDGGPKLPADITTKELKSWTDIGDEEAKRFAGTARYSIEIDIPAGADEWELDLGDVRESARVFINGKEAAGLFSVPFSAPVGSFLKTGRNLLEIEVTNLSANRIRDLDIRGVKWKIFQDINFVDHNYKKFSASKWPMVPSGLLGPVTLTPMMHRAFDE